MALCLRYWRWRKLLGPLAAARGGPPPLAPQPRCFAQASGPSLGAAGAATQTEAARPPPGKVVSVFRSELVQAGELARRLPMAIDSSDVQAALEIFKDLPMLMLPPGQLSAVAQQLLRVIMSYQHWMLPTALRDDLPGGTALWYVGVPAPGAEPGGAQLLPLFSGEEAYQSLVGAGVRGAGDGDGGPVMVKTVASGAQAVAEYMPAEGSPGRLEGLVINAGQYDELILGRDQLPQLRTWEATLRMEALLASELEEGGSEAPEPASAELAGLLARRARLFFVRTPQLTDLARDASGQNIMLLTSLDAVALCANAYGKQQLRQVTASELLSMASNAGGEFGYTLTLGPDRRPYDAGGEAKHVPMWHTRTVTADWLAEALREGGADQADA